MTAPDENYDSGDDGESSGASTGATGASGASTGESMGALTGPIPGTIATPATIAPASFNRVGTVARFALSPTSSRATSPTSYDDDDFDVFATMDTTADTTTENLIRQSILASVMRAVGPEHAGYNPRQLNETVSSMINPVHMDAVDPLGTLIRRMGCTNREQTRAFFTELLNSFITTMDHNDQVALRRMLRRLNRILNRRVRVRTINGRRNRTIRYSMQFINILGRFGCRTERARRMLYAFLNELRQRIVFRLRETRSRRQAPSTASKPDMQGGKNRSKSHKTQRCKSHKTQRCKSHKTQRCKSHKTQRCKSHKRNKRYSRKH